MDNYKLKFTRLQQEILRLLCIRAGSALSQREIAKLLGVSPTAVGKSIPLLVAEDLALIDRQATMNVKLISLERNMKAMLYKKIENMKQFYEHNFQEFLEETYPGTTIILFGSYAKGEDIVSSDIDVAIIGATKKNVSFSSFEKIFERTISVQQYSSFKDIHKELLENLCNGVVLAGSVQL